jgi:hypothetical protein
MKATHAKWLAGAVVMFAAIVLIARQAAPPQAGHSPGATPNARPASDVAESRIIKPTRRPAFSLREKLPELPTPVDSPFPVGSPESASWVEGRISELDRLSWYDDAESLAKILGELRNSLPEIRAAALSATIAFSSRDSIPYLEAIYRETRDPAEQKAITDAIEYLKLPTLIEELDKQQQQPQPEDPPVNDEPEPAGSSGR